MAEQEVKLKITTDASGAITGMKKVSDEMKRFESTSGSISGMIKRHWASIASAITVTSIVTLAKSALDQMDNVSKMSQKVGVSVEALQGYQYAARLADVESETLSKSLAKLAKNMYEMASASGSSPFRELGLSVTDSIGHLKTTDVMLEEIAEKFSHMKDGTEKTALAMKLFGKSGAELIPLLNAGKEGLQEMREEAEKLGIIFSAEDAARAEEFNDNISRIEMTFKGIATRVTGEVLPTLLNVSEAFIKNIKEGGGLKTTVEGLGDAFRILVSFGIGVVAAFDIIGTAIGGLAVKAEGFMTAVTQSKDILLQPGWAMSWSDKAGMLKKTWGQATADIGLGDDLEKKMQAYGSMIESVWDKAGKGKIKLPGAGGGGTAGGSAGANDELSQAMISWREKIEAMNPSVDRFDRQLMNLEKEANKLALKFGEQQWILEGLAKGQYFIEMAREMEETKRILDALYDTEKRYRELVQTGELRKTDINRQSGLTALDKERRILEEQSRYGIVTSGQLVERQLDLDRRTFEVERERMLKVIGIRSIYAETDEQMEEINALGYELLNIEQQITDLEDVRLLKLREYTGTFADGIQSGMAQYLASLDSNFQQGVNVARDSAGAMTDSFNDFLDRTSDGFMDLGNLATKVGNDIYKSMVENLISKPAAAGIGSFVTSLFGGSSPTMTHETAFALSAHGNVFSTPGLSPYLNTVVSRPTAFAFEHGVGFFGEKGRPGEAVMPLIRTKSGDLGVRTEGNSQSSVSVSLIVNNNTGQEVKARQETTQVNAQEMVVTLWLDALDRNAFGLKNALGG